MSRSGKCDWREGYVEGSEEKGDRREVIGGMRCKWKRTERRYIEAVRECQKPRAFRGLSLVTPVALLLRNGTTGAVGES